MLSIIIPTLNEAANLQDTLGALPSDGEVIVVDGGSEDETVAIAWEAGVKVVRSSGGRARQMNEGATVATGAILLFLHADTLLPVGFRSKVEEVLKQPGVMAGAFRLGITGDLKGLKWVVRWANWRSRFLSLPYGDQAIFLKRTIFEEMGGFPVLPIMEDFVFVRSLQKRGKIIILDDAVMTSPRRWQKLGVCQTTLINQLIILGYFLGFSPHQLAQWYRGK